MTVVASGIEVFSGPAPVVAGPAAGGPKHSADLPSLEMEVRLNWGESELQPYLPAWQRLVDVAAEPNPGYEPGCLLPALKYLRGRQEVCVASVWAAPRVNPQGPPVLCGLFPLRLVRRARGMAVMAELWRHDQWFLTTPLVRGDVLPETWQAFWDWIRSAPLAGRARCHLLGLPMQNTDGPFHGMLLDWMESQGVRSALRRRYRRALLHRPASCDSHSQALPRKLRQESTRLRRKLEQAGRLELRCEAGPAAVERFLELEQSGWKGRSGTALGATGHSRQFTLDMTARLAARNQLQVLEMWQGERLVASKLNLMSGHAAFAWKIAYDEEFSPYSPGVLLELENVRHLVERTPGVAWMDSCADPDHPMIDALWPGRRGIESLLLSTGSRRGNWILAAYPLARELVRQFRPRSHPG